MNEVQDSLVPIETAPVIALSETASEAYRQSLLRQARILGTKFHGDHAEAFDIGEGDLLKEAGFECVEVIDYHRSKWARPKAVPVMALSTETSDEQAATAVPMVEPVADAATETSAITTEAAIEALAPVVEPAVEAPAAEVSAETLAPVADPSTAEEPAAEFSDPEADKATAVQTDPFGEAPTLIAQKSEDETTTRSRTRRTKR